MPRKVDLETLENELDDEDELEDEDEQDDESSGSLLDDDEDEPDDDDEEEKPRKKSSGSGGANWARVIEEIRSLKQEQPQTKVEQKQAESKVKKLLGFLQKEGGFTAEQAAILGAFGDALIDDIKEAYEGDKKESSIKVLNEQVDEGFADTVDALIKKFPALKHSRHDLIQAGIDFFKNSRSEVANAMRNRYLSGKRPTREQFAKSLDKKARTILKDSGYKTSGKDQLGIKSTRSKPAPVTAGSEKSNGKLPHFRNDLEREVYLQTKNETKNEKIALQALEAVRNRK